MRAQLCRNGDFFERGEKNVFTLIKSSAGKVMQHISEQQVGFCNILMKI